MVVVAPIRILQCSTVNVFQVSSLSVDISQLLQRLPACQISAIGLIVLVAEQIEIIQSQSALFVELIIGGEVHLMADRCDRRLPLLLGRENIVAINVSKIGFLILVAIASAHIGETG